MKTSAKIKYLKNGDMVYEARISCGPAPRGYQAEDTDAWEADYEIDSFIPSYYDESMNRVGMTEGKAYMILSVHNILHPDPVYRLAIAADNGEGWAGNSNPIQKRYRGWRGTTCDHYACGQGLRKLISISTTGKRSKKLRIVFGPDTSN